MNKKYVWSVYIIGWIYFIFLDSSYSQGDHIFSYLIFGWIPFLALHFLWKNNEKNPSEPSQNIVKSEIHELVFDIANKDTFVSFVNQENQLSEAYEQVNQELQAFSESAGVELSDIEEHDGYMKLTPKQMDEFEKIKENRSKLLTVQHFSAAYVALVEEINKKLLAGLPFSDAKSLYESKLQTLHETKQKQEANIFMSKILGEVIADAKRKGNENIDIKEINKRVDAEVKRLSKKSK